MTVIDQETGMLRLIMKIKNKKTAVQNAGISVGDFMAPVLHRSNVISEQHHNKQAYDLL